MNDRPGRQAHQYHLAQFNIAQMKGRLEDPVMAGFVAQLEPINAVAESADGFVWRLKTETGDATDISVYDDETILVNMSVWESIDALFAYVYRSDHAGAFRDRHDWFDRTPLPTMVLWWIPVGHEPSPVEGKERLEELRRAGPTERAFTFKRRFPPPNALS